MKRIAMYILVMGTVSGCATPNNPPIDMEATMDEAYIETNDMARDVGRAAVVVAKDNGAEALSHTYKFEQALKAGFYHTTDSLADWIQPAGKPKPPRAIAASYCYHSLQDILCYRQPMPGWEHRLVAYQGTYAKAPPPAMMQPLAMRRNDSSMLPASRVASAQPVFAEPPPSPREKPKPDPDQVAPDPTHEQLPDPALAPQL